MKDLGGECTSTSYFQTELSESVNRNSQQVVRAYGPRREVKHSKVIKFKYLSISPFSLSTLRILLQ